MAYIRTCVQNLGEIRRPVRNNCPSSLIIDICNIYILDNFFNANCQCRYIFAINKVLHTFIIVLHDQSFLLR